MFLHSTMFQLLVSIVGWIRSTVTVDNVPIIITILIVILLRVVLFQLIVMFLTAAWLSG